MKKWTRLVTAGFAAVSVVVMVACSGGSEDATPTPIGQSGPGAIEGTVTGPGGEPVAGMRIGIVGGTASFPEIAPETDQEGHYRIGGVPPGTFEVAVHDRDGQRVGLGSVTVTSGKTATLDFTISAGARGGAVFDRFRQESHGWPLTSRGPAGESPCPSCWRP